MSISAQATPAENARRIAGLDTIRLFAALVVCMSHGMLIPPQIYLDKGTRLEFWSGAIGHMFANGAAAVALFFVISGLCIHLGREAAARDPLLFLTRRLVRIGIPLATMLAIAALLGSGAQYLLKGVLWSIYCELAYYLAYPLLLLVRRKVRLEYVLSVSAAASVALVAILPPVPLIWQYGLATAVICYPLWIFGALLAEHSEKLPPRSDLNLWTSRRGLVLAFGVCSAARHLPWAQNLPVVTYAVTGLLAWPFLSREIAYAKAVPPPALTEKLGKASYSIYLTHRIPLYFVDNATSTWPQWIAGSVELLTVAVCAWVFYSIVEGPALSWAKSLTIRRGDFPWSGWRRFVSQAP